jgi:hypothetical protein
MKKKELTKLLDLYYLAKRQNDTKRQLEIADDLVARWIPNLLGGETEESHG